MDKGKFIGVGVGPGDSELLTVKGIKTLKSVPVICAPKSSKDKPSLALSIVQNILNERKDDYVILEPLFPMIEDKRALENYWKGAAQLVIDELDQGKDVSFITLGDPSIYSTFSYIAQIIQDEGYIVEMVPGITSFTSCAASAGITLSEKDEIVIVVPKVDQRLEEILEHADTAVIMKTSRHSEMLEDIIKKDSRDKKIISVQNCGMKDEKIFNGFAKKGKYLSTTIVKFEKNK
ncbi:MAG: precorrin-2 C(20)-methyltransferase [Euryarchaeota archaeon]|jgi:precorrin-2/cobalt-factor-2 C20-methyltransferase|uniref:precorrin-2 C(20)-methyltransferase n=1 Tax=Methanobacterium sp. MZD130B TaxID=3394378 RepID=UPI00176E72D0|nr:precorrin-2 C(20)-methyltransferase [Euryarchaeota archaeon]HHT18466.1 precorrin-2 C(20)-methyltransferase [Methanobacterium sp.]